MGCVVWEQVRTLYSPSFIYPGSNPVLQFWGSCRLTDLAFNQWPISTAWFKRTVLKSAFILRAKLPQFPMEKPQCSNEPQLFIYRRKSQWQNSSDCLRSTRERGPAEICHILWDLWESRTVFPRQAAFPASSLAAWSFSETLHGNYAEEIIWSSAN